ncbi:MAG TPA: sugar nucleotide-binding protein [Bosea sp. (in: a-proteobacteria)]|nr:sugar nucleotide-binding protein [Bosea sp. (in: a-proteobacteria)]
MIAAISADELISRILWVYSPSLANYGKAMLHLAETRNEIGVISDGVGSSTSAFSPAVGLGLNLMRCPDDEGLRGTFHAPAGWADFARSTFADAKASGGAYAAVRSIGMVRYPSPVPRPVYSVFDTARLRLRHWVSVRKRRASVARLVDLTKTEG